MNIPQYITKALFSISLCAAAMTAQAGRVYTDIGFNLGGVQISVPIAVPVLDVPVYVRPRPVIPVQQQVVTTYNNGYQQTVTQTTTTYGAPVEPVYGQTSYYGQPVYVPSGYTLSSYAHNCRDRERRGCGYSHRDHDDDTGYNRYQHNDGRANYQGGYTNNYQMDNGNNNQGGYGNQRGERPAQRPTTTYVPIAVPTTQRSVVTPVVPVVNNHSNNGNGNTTYIRPAGL